MNVFNNDTDPMILKFHIETLTCKKKATLFSWNEESTYIAWMSDIIKNIFDPIQTREEWGKIIEQVDSKYYGDKYLNIKYSSREEQVWEIIPLTNGKLFILPLKVAEDDSKISEMKEVVDEATGDIILKIPPEKRTNIFWDYFFWIYLVNKPQVDDRGQETSNGYIFYTQKGRTSIRMLIKKLLDKLLPWMTIILQPDTTKKKILDFEASVNRLTYTKNYKPSEIDPNVDDDVKDSIELSIKTEVIVKRKNKRARTMSMFNSSSKKMLRSIANSEILGISLENSSVDMGGTKINQLSFDEEDNIVWIIQNYIEINNNNYNKEHFKELCRSFFNQIL